MYLKDSYIIFPMLKVVYNNKNAINTDFCIIFTMLKVVFNNKNAINEYI